MSVSKRSNQESLDDAKEERRRLMNKSDFAPGMEEDDNMADFGNFPDDEFGSWGDSGSSKSDNSGLSSGWDTSGSVFGNQPMSGDNSFGSFPSWGSPATPQQPEKKEEMEDKFFSVVGKIFKGFFTFSKDFFMSFKTFDVHKRVTFGRSLLFSSIAVTVTGLVLLLFGVSVGFSLLIGGLVSCGIGAFSFMVFYEAARDSDPRPPDNEPENSVNLFGGEEWGSKEEPGNEWGNGEFSDFKDGDDDGEYPFDEDDEYPFEEDDVDSYDSYYEPHTSVVESGTTQEDREKILDAIVPSRGMVTRAYIYEQMYKVLPSILPNYAEEKEIPEDSPEFDEWNAKVVDSGKILKRDNSDDLPYLIEARDRLFYMLLEVNRPKWLRIAPFVEEVQSLYRYDEKTGMTDMNLHVRGSTRGTKIDLKVMKKTNVMVSLKDMYSEVSAAILDPSNLMPVVLGLDEYGMAVWKDFKYIDTMLVTGMPRSGKTWLVQSIMTQLCMYNSPEDLNIYFIDPKGSLSDYRSMTMPHVKKFVSGHNDILKEMRYVVNVLAEERKEIVGSDSQVNIWDYKKKNPDVSIPLIYVVIDEVVSLAEKMPEDIRKEFNSLLVTIVTELPAVGIRVFMIPHKINDKIIKKTATDMISFRVSVKGDQSHIESNVGDSKFTHKLINMGDTATRIGNEAAFFMHSGVLTPTNEDNADLYDFITKFWLRVNPDYIKGSLYEKDMQEKERANAPKVRITEAVEPVQSKSALVATNPAVDLSYLRDGIHDEVTSKQKGGSDAFSEDFSGYGAPASFDVDSEPFSSDFGDKPIGYEKDKKKEDSEEVNEFKLWEDD